MRWFAAGRQLRHCQQSALKTTIARASPLLPLHRRTAYTAALLQRFTSPTTTTTTVTFASHTPSFRRAMSSDAADYEAFLKKAQKDYSEGYEPPADTERTATITAEVDPHPAIRALGERFYVSEVDEAFEFISFSWEKELLPTIDEFSDLTGSDSGSIEVLEPKDWDHRNEYQDVRDAVATACAGGEVKVYRVQRGARVTYYVLGVDVKARKIVGVRVKAVES
ncbi:hypothetical protein FN846DRAFT_978150 [Sphaerosporella brunnea]|uniref:Uncharacterized protein n=1 Tax=Sphaerosporella brunnea TaxID=1250544 RepID=A0A5J5EFV9_9PEZI|nr:hypothetical protein FN846DRAFT_978150 [Sphaerosporella brunnea]